jgi:hypothetical protein
MEKIEILSLERIVAPEGRGQVSPARRAADSLLRAGMNGDTLELDLNNVILNLSVRDDHPIIGKTRRKANYFPKRLLKFAGEIEQVTSRLVYELLDSARIDPKGKEVSWLLNGSYKETLQAFGRLPNLLKAYGEFVRFAIRKKIRTVACQDHFAITLMQHVRQATGKSYYPELESLLAALFKVSKFSSPYTQSRLRDLYRRNRLRLRPLYISLKT